MLNIPAGWKLVPERATQAMEDAWDATPANEDINAEFHAAYAAMLAAAPSAPGDAQDDDSDIPELRSEAEIGFEDWLTRQMPKGTVISNPAWWAPRILRAVERLIRAEEQLAAAPAAGDALDAARYRWLCDKFGITKLPCAIERIIEGSYVPDGKAAIDAAIDAAIAAQRKGDA